MLTQYTTRPHGYCFRLTGSTRTSQIEASEGECALSNFSSKSTTATVGQPLLLLLYRRLCGPPSTEQRLHELHRLRLLEGAQLLRQSREAVVVVGDGRGVVIMGMEESGVR